MLHIIYYCAGLNTFLFTFLVYHRVRVATIDNVGQEQVGLFEPGPPELKA